ncbi:MAG: S8 family serine peptidase, partial [Candidatus Promineifilaceae bacterium]|nr:S8 family serine peptidase [Candidatus Promineifilaceae bacterium]
MVKKQHFVIMLLVALLALVAASVPDAAASPPEISAALGQALESAETVDVLVQMNSHEYAAAVQAITDSGGTVTHQFRYADGLAATVPVAGIEALALTDGVTKIGLDVMRQPAPDAGQIEPGSIALGRAAMSAFDNSMSSGEALVLGEEFQTLSLEPTEAADFPAVYNSVVAQNAGPVWADGNFGQETLAVVIDTGIYADHFMLDGSVVGGVDLSADVGTAYEGFDLASNHWHGTHVSGILAGHGAVLVGTDSLLARSIELYTGSPLPTYDA